MSDFATLSTPDLLKKKLAAQRQLHIVEARQHLMPFIKLMMPDPEDMDDASKSQYQTTPQGTLLCEVIEDSFNGVRKRAAVSIGPQLGKALAVGTPIPTPAGWTNIEDLKPGDEVFGENGQIVLVLARGEIFNDRAVCEVRTDDGFSVIADMEHEWPVRMSRSWPVKKIKTTAQLLGRTAERNVRLAVPGPLDTQEADLPIDPYCLGAWLGDGQSQGAIMCAPGDDGAFIEAQFQAAGYQTRRYADPKSFGIIKGFHRALADAGLAGNKHIPLVYFRASRAQRLALLQGLIDTDGHCAPGGNIEFCNTNLALAEGVRDLVVSLGRKCRLAEGRATLYGRDCGPKYRVCFYMAGAARLPRKAKECRNAKCKPNRYITVREAGRADTVCIQVDNATNLYLCGRGMLVTHNSQILTRATPAWWLGRRPRANIIVGTYNQPFANQFGDDIRTIIETQAYRQVFPKLELDGKAKDYITTTKGGKLSMVGVGASGTGKAADVFIVDDPFKNDEDANSDAYREKVWKWFTSVVYSRLHNKSVVIVVHTRWQEDDLIGRLCDPDHPDRNKKYRGVAADWLYLNIPAVVTDEKLAKALGLTLAPPAPGRVTEQFGHAPMTTLWPERKSLDFLAESRNLDSRVFDALYMGKPSPDDGDFFTSDYLVGYQPEELPKNLRKYGASDHAVTEKQQSDSSVIGCVGVDDDDNIWVLPDLFWNKVKTDRVVENIIAKMQVHKPALWWMESELISKSFGPFLLKRMQETKTYFTLDPVTPTRDKLSRASAIQGRMSMKKVRFPVFAPWWKNARSQILKFPYGTHDDFVDWLSLIGQGMLKLYPAAVEKQKDTQTFRTGSIQWILAESKRKALKEKAESHRYAYG